MRITEKQMMGLAMQDIKRQHSDVYKLQRQAISGRRIHDVQDDPSAAVRYRMITEARRATEDHGRNSDLSRTSLEASDSTLAEAGNLLLRAKEIAIAMANGTAAAEDRAICANEVSSLFDTMIGLANTRVAGDYIFAGFSIDQPPFQSDGTFVGDNGVKKVKVGEGAAVSVNVSGATAFTAAGGVDVFAELENLRVALQTNDMTGINAALDTMDTALGQINISRADAGLKLNQLDVADAVRGRLEDSLLGESSRLVDTDTVEVLLGLNAATNSLQQAMAVSQQIVGTISLG